MRMQTRARRKISGGLYKDNTKKKIHMLGRDPRFTKIDAKRVKILRIRSGDQKFVLFAVDKANIYDAKTKKYQQAKIKTILENPANRHFVRRNILTKGSIIDTELGKARVTNRPGQEGVVNAILL